MKRVFKWLLIAIAGLAVLGLLLASLAYWWLLYVEEVPEPGLAGVTVAGALMHQGRERTWHAYIPPGDTDGMPLLLVMHGSQGDGGQMIEATRYEFNRLAQADGFIPVYPDGFERHWNDCRAGANYSANTLDIDDVGFLGALVAHMVETHGVDRSRVYATGISNGGHMAYRLGLEAPELVAGIAAIVANMPVPGNLGCRAGDTGLPTLIINGTDDPVTPYDGGVIDLFGDTSRGRVLSSLDSALYWARLAGHEGDGVPRQWPDRAPDDGTRVESLSWSAPGKPSVMLVSVIGGGHTIPHPHYRMPRILGPTSHEFDAAGLIWNFLTTGDAVSGTAR